MIKILIADDESYERSLLGEIIDKRFGREAEIRMAENGRLAVDAALWAADVALMDIEMPGVNGIDAARQILAQRPECKIIFVTAYSLFEYAHEAVKLGACDYILKPVEADDVERAVRRAAAQSEAQRQLEAVAASSADLLDSADSYDKTNLLMGKVKKYLQHNYMACDISLDSVSAILNLNSAYFSTLFKRTFGVNFLDYLTELRMEAAKNLLADPLRSTAEVAGMVGYESANYFTRAFKKKVGMTPTDYRRAAAQNRGGDS